MRPADFTAVCTNGFMVFARHAAALRALFAGRLGLSIGPAHARIAWMRNIRERFGAGNRFPIIEDISMQVAPAFVRIHPGASDSQAVRATFFIDPDGILCAP